MIQCSILDQLEKNNEFPIIFIGSGISKRYLEAYPSWKELLQELWKYSGREGNFFAYLNKTKNVDDIDFQINVRVAGELEEEINNKFDDEIIEIEGLTHEEVYEKSTSPFKKLLSNKFSNYHIKENCTEELESFVKMLLNF